MSFTYSDREQLLIDLTAGKESKFVVNSYNHMIEHQIPKIIQDTQLKVGPYTVTFPHKPLYKTPSIGSVGGENKSLEPYMCFLEKHTYSSRIHMGIKIQFGKSSVEHFDIPVGAIPIMIGSGLDTNWSQSKTKIGGYFISEGNEFVLQNKELLRRNVPFMYNDKKGIVLRYTSMRNTETSVNVIQEKIERVHCYYSAMFSYSSSMINIYIAFQLLGMSFKIANRIMESMIVSDDKKLQDKMLRNFRLYMELTKNEFNDLMHMDDKEKEDYQSGYEEYYEKNGGNVTEDDYFNYIKLTNILREKYKGSDLLDEQKYKESWRELVLNDFYNNFFSNIEYNRNHSTNSLALKAKTFAYCVVKYSLVRLGFRSLDDRDSWANKVLYVAAEAILTKFVNHWKNEVLVKITQALSTIDPKDIMKKVKDIGGSINTERLITDYEDSFRKRTWNMTKKKQTVFVEQINLTLNILAALLIIRRIITPTNKQADLKEKRFVHQSQVNIICPSYSPERETCGLVKDPSVLMEVSVDRETEDIEYYLKKFITPRVDEKHQNLVLVNGMFRGFGNTVLLKKYFDELRRLNKIPRDAGVIYNEQGELWIYTTGGRPIIMLFVVNKEKQILRYEEQGIPLTNIDLLFKSGSIEYIDSAEQVQPYVTIAVNPEQIESYRTSGMPLHEGYTHCLIQENQIYGYPSANVNFSQHNPSTRIAYDGNMEKSVLGTDIGNMNTRFETNIRIMPTADVPLVSTATTRSMTRGQFFKGKTLMVAIATAGGYNEEDCIQINRNIRDLGIIVYTIYHGYSTTLSTAINMTEKFTKLPSDPVTGRIFKPKTVYSKLGEEGIIGEGEKVYEGDCLVGKVMFKDGSGFDSSMYVEKGKEGIVDEVIKTTNSKSNLVIYIRIREHKQIENGDKMKTGYSQKGVVGLIVAPYDMPTISTLRVYRGEKEIAEYEKYKETLTDRADLEELRTIDKTRVFTTKDGKVEEKIIDVPVLRVTNPRLDGKQPDVLFNPHGIPTRMTIGKIIEMLVTTSAIILGKRINSTSFQKFDYKKFLTILRENGFDEYSSYNLIDGATGIKTRTKIFIGPIYYQVLNHLVKYKCQGRRMGPRQLLTGQPVNGIRKDGGNRVGEMERDNIIAYGCAYLLLERMSISSDEYTYIACSRCHAEVPYTYTEKNYMCRICKSTENLYKVSSKYAWKLLRSNLAGAGINVKQFISMKE